MAFFEDSFRLTPGTFIMFPKAIDAAAANASFSPLLCRYASKQLFWDCGVETPAIQSGGIFAWQQLFGRAMIFFAA
jgi:hypothetical protein